MKKKLITLTIFVISPILSYFLINGTQKNREVFAESEKEWVSGGIVQEEDFASMFQHVFTQDIAGEGYIRWDKWNDITDEEILSGNLYLPYISDEVYTSMKLPSEVGTAMSYRTNPSLGEYQPEGYINAVGMGAIYQVPGTELPAEFDVCIGKFRTYILKDAPDAEWEVLDAHEPLDDIKYFRCARLPWSLGISWRPSKDIFTYYDDYVQVHLTKKDLTNRVFHFYGIKQPCISEDILGMVVIFEVWSNTEDVVGKIACTIGADQRNESGTVSQAFSGRNYMVLNQTRLIIGHNMPDSVYDKCVEMGKSPEKCIELFMED